MDTFNLLDALSTTEFDHLRGEALKLYDHCLVEGNPVYITRFVERQLSFMPPRLDLLRGIADDLQQRLFTLRENLFNVRQKVVNTFWDIYNVDIAPLIPPDQLHTYHRIKPQAFIDCVFQHGIKPGPEEIRLVAGMVKTSLQMAEQLQADIELTVSIRDMIADWLNALSTQLARFDRDWIMGSFTSPGDEIIH